MNVYGTVKNLSILLLRLLHFTAQIDFTEEAIHIFLWMHVKVDFLLSTKIYFCSHIIKQKHPQIGTKFQIQFDFTVNGYFFQEEPLVSAEIL